MMAYSTTTISNFESTPCLVLAPYGNPIVELGDGTTTLALFKDILTTLQNVHNYGVFHRDINPKNMVVVREGDRNRAYLIDWNIAILSTDTENDDFSCTPLYTSHNRLLALLLANERRILIHRATIWNLFSGLFLMSSLERTLDIDYHGTAILRSHHR